VIDGGCFLGRRRVSEELEPESGAEPEPCFEPGAIGAVGVAVALDEARNDLGLRAPVARFLERQEGLIENQNRLIGEQLHHLKEQYRQLRLKHWSERLKLLLQAMTVGVGALIAAGFGVTIWQAAHDTGLVVEAFSVPPDLAQRGLTGQVVGKQVLDRLAAMQAQTTSLRPANSYKNNWGEDLKVEIPETGVSLGELRRYLNGWLGHETRISGEVYRTASGLTVTARPGEDDAKTFTGPDADLDKLIDQAAAAVYESTQPYRYAVYLEGHGRLDEAKAILQRLTFSPDPVERAWAHVGLGNQRFDVSEAEVLSEMKLALGDVPDFPPALVNIAQADFTFGRYEPALRASQDAVAAVKAGRGGAGPRQAAYTQGMDMVIESFILGDFADGARESSRTGRTLAAYRSYAAGFLALDHDTAGARAAASGLGEANPFRPLALGQSALDDGDKASVALLETASKLARNGDSLPQYIAERLVLAKIRFGDVAGAEAVVAGMPTDCYPCVQARGWAAVGRGDRAGAERWFAAAIRQAPRVPLAYVDRGQARLAWGDVQGALADAEATSRTGPHDPDALKLWGDALARLGRRTEALAKYDAAMKEAPAWTALKQARAAAAARGG
jgi:tetratricopeptide (TPR) repeat protein